MPAFPQDRSLDSTLALLREGYAFGTERFKRYRTDVFGTRLMFRKALCAMGEDAAHMFYEPDRFTRKGAMPPTALMLLQDRGSVQWLDADAHRHRKRMFMGLMGPTQLAELGDLLERAWTERLADWERRDRVILHDAVQEVLCRAIAAWAGVPLGESEARQRTREFAAMIDGAGAVGPRNWRGMWLRARTERWARELIEALREGRLEPEVDDSPLHVIAAHRDLDGELLDSQIAAVELINLLRPTVAVGRYIVFAALALHEHRESRRRIAAGDEAYLDWFVHEVRRFYPFFPFVGGRAREPFEWRGERLDAGTWVLIDVYATGHDPRLWDAPERFEPERFRDWDGNAFGLIPQGGGDFDRDHRCAGEWITVDLMKRAVRRLTRGMDYVLPAQDLGISLARMPALPSSGFVIENIKRLS